MFKNHTKAQLMIQFVLLLKKYKSCAWFYGVINQRLWILITFNRKKTVELFYLSNINSRI